MTPPAESDDESNRSAYWQGVMGTKLDTVIEEVRRLNDGKEAEHARIHARIAGVEARTDSLESTRDKALGAMALAGAGGGVLGGVLSSVITYLIIG